MNNNQPPFYVGQKVVTTEDCATGAGIICTVEYCEYHGRCNRCGKYVFKVKVEEYPSSACQSCFAPYNPYQESLTKQLAEQAMQDKPEVDVVVKETVNN